MKPFSLNCVVSTTMIFIHIIKKFQLILQVVLGLNQCLDDKKRLVRQEAVKTKIRWTILDS